MSRTIEEIQKEQIALQDEIDSLQEDVKDVQNKKHQLSDNDIPIFSEEYQNKIISLEKDIISLKEQLNKLQNPDPIVNKIVVKKLRLKERFDNLWKKSKPIVK